MVIGATAKLACVVLSTTLSVGVVPRAMFVADEPITPSSAAGARFSVEQQGQRLSAAGSHDQAAQLYWQQGFELKDPLLIIEAAEAWREHARAQRSIDAADSAIATAQVALDMLYFLRDSATSANWQPIEPAQVHVIIARGEAVVSEANALIAEIEDEQRRASEPPPPEPKKGAKPGTGLIAGGSVAIVLGLGGAGLGVAGLFMGAAAQRDVEDPLVYEPEHSEAEARGRRSNVFAGVGLAVAGVGVGVGAALIALGVKKRKLSGGSSAMIVPSISADGAGLSVVGRF